MTLPPTRIERKNLADLTPAPYNPRTISDEALAGLGESIRRFGLVEPVIWNTRTGHVVGGHQRLKVLRAAGETETDCVIVDLPEAEEKALNLALNSPLIAGTFTDRALEVLADVKVNLPALAAAVRLPDLERDLARLFARPLEDTPGPAPALEGLPAVAATGDLIRCGRHLILCGSATDPAAYTRLLQGERAACVFTDPPYGVDYQATSGIHQTIAGDALHGDALAAFIGTALRLAADHAAPTAAFYIWHASSTRQDFDRALRAAGLVERQYLIWAKPAPVLGHADYLWCHEPCYYAAKQGQTPAWYGGRDQPTVWRFASRTEQAAHTTIGTGLILTDGSGDHLFIAPRPPKGRRYRRTAIEPGASLVIAGDEPRYSIWTVAREPRGAHPNQKPTALSARALHNSTREGDLVLDVFAGSGSTLLAAEETGRRAALIELDPRFVDLAVRRWEIATGGHGERVQ